LLNWTKSSEDGGKFEADPRCGKVPGAQWDARDGFVSRRFLLFASGLSLLAALFRWFAADRARRPSSIDPNHK